MACGGEPASLPDNDDILSEILVRLPPEPSSLPRASLVCRTWRRLVRDPAFVRRFRAHHRRGAPLLGFFAEGMRGPRFTPTLGPPNRVPKGRFSLPLDGKWAILGCRHGLVLLVLRHSSRRHQLLVWDPVTGDQRRIDVPPGFADEEVLYRMYNGSVLRAAGDVHGGDGSSSFQFQVVLLSSDMGPERAFVCVYSSLSGVWSDPISTACRGTSALANPSSLVGCSLYWSLWSSDNHKFRRILEFDLDTQRLAVIDMPSMPAKPWVIPAEGGAFDFLCLSKLSIHLWKGETDFDGVVGWVLRRTIMLDSVLPLRQDEPCHPMISGFADDDNVLLIGIKDCVFTIQLDSMKFTQSKIPLKKLESCICHPFSSVYTAGMVIDGEPEGAELLRNI